MRAGLLPCLLALVALPPVGAQVDTAKRNEPFDPRPSEQEQVEMKRTEVGGSRTAADEKIEFVTVPADVAGARLPAVREKQKAPIDMSARPVPMRHPEPATISTADPAPGRFDRTFATPAVARIQDGMTEAGRVKTAAVKANARPSVLERINRFVFRRNEPVPATTPAGGENTPVEGAATPADSTGS